MRVAPQMPPQIPRPGAATADREEELLLYVETIETIGLHGFQNSYECLWAKISTPNSEYYVAAVYHPPSSEYLSGDFLDFLIDAVEHLHVFANITAFLKKIWI